MTPDFVKERLTAIKRETPAGEAIILDEYEKDGGTITVSIGPDALAGVFADVDTTGDADTIRDRLKAADVTTDADGNTINKGYGRYIDQWHAEGLLGPPDTPGAATLPSGRVLDHGKPVA